MKPDVVVDIGNTRIKWGRCVNGRVAEMVSLAGDIPEDWSLQAPKWNLDRGLTWAVAGVQPKWQKLFTRWAEARDGRVVAITRDHIPIPVEVDEPDAVGIDRLLNALAAHRIADPQPTIVLSVGTAVTCDLVDHTGTFLGGVIFPGPRLMAESLHAHTAKLPLVDALALPEAEPPGKNTRDAILAGIRYAIVGAAYMLVDRYAAICGSPWVFVTGGAAGDLGEINFGDPFVGTRAVPTLTLEGIRIAAEAMP